MLSTCNRTEVYVVAERFHGAYSDVRDFLAELRRPGARGAAPTTSTAHYDEDAVAPSVRGRGRARLGRARRERDPRPGPRGVGGGAGRWRRAAPPSTAVPPRGRGRQAGPHRNGHRSRHTASVSTAAVAMAAERARWPRRSHGARARRRRHRRGHGRRTGGGRRGRGARREPHVRPCRRRSPRAVGGRSVRLLELADALGEVDVLLTSTGAAVDARRARRDRRARDGGAAERPLLVVDVAVPRDVDPGVASIAGVTLLDMDDLRGFADKGSHERRSEIAGCAGHRRRRGRSLDRSTRPLARSRRSSPPCASGPTTCGRPSSIARRSPARRARRSASARPSRRSPAASSPSCCTSRPCA